MNHIVWALIVVFLGINHYI